MGWCRHATKRASAAPSCAQAACGTLERRLSTRRDGAATRRRARWQADVAKHHDGRHGCAVAARGVSGDMSGAAVNTAALQLAVSGVSFLLTMIFLGLQVFDSGHERAPSRWADPARKRTLSHRSPPRSTTSSLLSKAASTIAEAVAPKRQKARRGERERRAAKKAEEVRV